MTNHHRMCSQGSLCHIVENEEPDTDKQGDKDARDRWKAFSHAVLAERS